MDTADAAPVHAGAPAPVPAADPAEAATDGATPDAAAEGAAAAPKAGAKDLSPAACAAKLAELFPALFATQPAAAGQPPLVKPIKLRIHADIQARAPGVFTKRALGFFFSRYTTTTPYLKALAHAPHRFDLDGQPAGDVDDVHRQAAGEEVARRRTIAIEKRAAERRAAPRQQQAPREGQGVGPQEGAAPSGEQSARHDGPRDAQPQGLRQGPREARGDTRHRDRPAGPSTASRPPHDRPRDGQRPPGAPRHDGPPRHPRADPRRPSPGGDAPQRGDRADMPPPRDRNDPRQGPRPQGGHHAPRRERGSDTHEAPLPQDPAQRDRALLLRAFEGSPLSKANFCALKRLNEADLDVQLELARKERGAPRGAAGGGSAR